MFLCSSPSNNRLLRALRGFRRQAADREFRAVGDAAEKRTPRLGTGAPHRVSLFSRLPRLQTWITPNAVRLCGTRLFARPQQPPVRPAFSRGCHRPSLRRTFATHVPIDSLHLRWGKVVDVSHINAGRQPRAALSRVGCTALVRLVRLIDPHRPRAPTGCDRFSSRDHSELLGDAAPTPLLRLPD